MNEHPVAVGDRGDDAGGDIILRRKNTRCLEIPIVGLGPKLRARLGVDELGADANAGSFLAEASLQAVARTELRAQGLFVFSLSLQASHRGARNDRQIPKPRQASHDLLG